MLYYKINNKVNKSIVGGLGKKMKQVATQSVLGE